MASSNSAEDENSSRRVNLIAMTTPNLNATATFKAGMLDLERRMNAAGDKRSCVTCFGRQNSMHNLGRPSQVQMSGKKILKALSSFSCISSKSISMSNSPSKREQQQRSLDLKDGVVKRSPAFEDVSTPPPPPPFLPCFSSSTLAPRTLQRCAFRLVHTSSNSPAKVFPVRETAMSPVHWLSPL